MIVRGTCCWLGIPRFSDQGQGEDKAQEWDWPYDVIRTHAEGLYKLAAVAGGIEDCNTWKTATH